MVHQAAADESPRVEKLLEHEPVIWLSTVRPDGRPHVIPTWFLWDGEAVLFASKPDASKIANLRTNAACMIGVGDPAADFDVALIEARAELTSIRTGTLLASGLRAKYADKMAEIGLSPATFADTYRQVVRLVPTRWLPWHGRTPRVAWRPSAAMAV